MTLYSLKNADGQVIEWDVDTGKVLRTLPLFQTSITKLALSSTDNLLLVGSSSVKLVDLSSGATVAEYSGHVSPITTMSFSLDDKLFAVGCEDDRFVNVWPVCNQDDMPVVQTKKKKRTASGSSSTLYNQPLVTLSLDSAPVHVTISTSTVAQSAKSKKAVSTSTHLSTVSARGVACVWDLTAAVADFCTNSVIPKDTTALAQPGCEISCAGNTDRVGAAVAAKSAFSVAKTRKTTTTTTVSAATEGAIYATEFVGGQLHVARYSSIHPQFELVAFLDAKAAFIPTIELPPMSPQHLALESASTKVSDSMAKTTAEATTVGPALVGITPSVSNLDSDAPVYATDALNIQAQRMQLLAASGELTRALAQRIQFARANSDALAAQPMGGSLQTMLAQAVHTGDDKMLEQCIAIGASRTNRSLKSNTIRNTVARLAPTHVVPLVSRLINKLQGNPNRGLELIPWIRECLRQHTTHLLTTPNLASQLSTLYKIVEQRLMPRKKLLSLQGRLDLILSQVNRSVAAFATSSGPSLEYNEAEDIEQERMLAQDDSALMAFGDDSDDDEDMGEFTDDDE
jgi:U3 small nucleolar RNA-associated protein 5